MERSGVFPTTEFAYRKGLGTCDSLLCVSHTLQTALESGQEAGIVQIDFSAAFDRVNHWEILNEALFYGYWRSCQRIVTGIEKLYSQNHREKNFYSILLNNNTLVIINV